MEKDPDSTKIILNGSCNNYIAGWRRGSALGP